MADTVTQRLDCSPEVETDDSEERIAPSHFPGEAAPLTGFGAGKVILLGEHAGVYGHPVLAGPLSRGVRARARPARQCRLAP